MKKFKKYFHWGLLGLFVVGVGAQTYYRVVIYPGEVRQECASRALKFVQGKQKTERVYGTSEADYDYKFAYRYCFQEKGLQSEE